MRREGYEFAVSRPQVIYKHGDDGELLEPMELLMIEVPENYVGVVMEKLGSRKAEIVNMVTRETGVSHLEFRIPSRGLMGYRQQFLTDTNGNGIMNSVFDGYEPYKGDIPQRVQGSLVVFETGETSSYGLFNAQDRGALFVGPSISVYEGMIVGQSPKNEDIVVNVCKKKHVTNMRAAGSDEALRLTPPTVLSLEQSLEFINDDELVEITPQSIRLRKRILSRELRMKEAAKKKA
jgi:GTP-binding protein